MQATFIMEAWVDLTVHNLKQGVMTVYARDLPFNIIINTQLNYMSAQHIYIWSMFTASVRLNSIILVSSKVQRV